MAERFDLEKSLIILEQLDKHNSLRFSELRKNTKISPDTLVRKLKYLERHSLLKREVNADRNVNYSITKKGRECYQLLLKLNRIMRG